MNCKDFDLKGYFLEELSTGEGRAVEDHLGGCAACRTELERLRLTQTTLLKLADEPMPQRIAFVSDKVLGPTWWQRFWQSGPRLGFAAAAMLSAAIVVHAFVRPPAPSQAPTTANVVAMQAAFEQRVEREVQARVAAAVDARLAKRETDYQTRLEAAVADAEKRMQSRQQEELRAVQDAYEVLRKQNNINYSVLASLKGM